MTGGPRLAGALAFAAALLGARPGRADGFYGRIAGDLSLHPALGLAVGEGAPALTLGATLLYLHTAGVTTRYGEALGEGSFARRYFAPGVEVRPLFLARALSDQERGPAWLDLAVDSLGLGLAAAWEAREGGLLTRPGLDVALGLDLPLGARAEGVFLEVRGVVRLRHEDLLGVGTGGGLARGAHLSIALAYHHIFSAGAVHPLDPPSR